MRNKKLLVKTQGIRGGKFHSNVQGQVNCCLLDEYNGSKQEITIDNYVGLGNDYKQRELPLIQIDSNGFNWTGTFDQLTSIISFARQMQWLCQADAPANYKAEVERIMQEAQQLFTSKK